MDKLNIKCDRNVFTIQSNDTVLVIPKDESSKKWAQLVCPYIESSQMTHNKMLHIIKEQYHLLTDQMEISLQAIKEVRKTDNLELHANLEDILELTMEWQDSIQEAYHLYKMD